MALWHAHDPLLELEWTLGNMLNEGKLDTPTTQRRPTAPAPKPKSQAASKPQQTLSSFAQDLHWAVQAGQFDIVETADAFELVTDVPGFSQADVAVEFHEGVLTISGKHQHPDNHMAMHGQQPPSDEKQGHGQQQQSPDNQQQQPSGARQGQEQQQQPAAQQQQEAGMVKVWRRERCQYQFTRSFRLPEDVKAEDIAAHLDKGVLTVRVPKLPPAPKPQPRRIAVQGAPAEAA